MTLEAIITRGQLKFLRVMGFKIYHLKSSDRIFHLIPFARSVLAISAQRGENRTQNFG